MVTSRQSAQEAGWRKKEKELGGETEGNEQGERGKGKKEKGRKERHEKIDQKVR